MVFLVAFPLSMGIALASGAPLESGVWAAIVGGVVVGLLGGAPLQVSGPSAGLTLLVLELIRSRGLTETFLIVSLAGVFQILAGLLKIARFAFAVPVSVIQGLQAAIGAMIVLSQLHIVMGDKTRATPLENLLELPRSLHEGSWTALSVGALTILLIYFWRKMFPQIARYLPGPLITILLLTGVITLLRSHLELDLEFLVFERTHLRFQTPYLNSLPELLTENSLDFLLPALMIFFMASAESLLCAIAADRLHAGPRANLSKELIAQGTGNLVSGLIGGLPIAGVILRSATNIGSGATSRLSSILHGVWIWVAVALLIRWMGLIPMASLAGFLIWVGFSLVDLNLVRSLRAHHELKFFWLTFLGILVLGMIPGLLLGILGAWTWHRFHPEKLLLHREGDRLTLRGAVRTFHLPRLMNELDSRPSLHLRADLRSLKHDLGAEEFLQSQAREGRLIRQ